jgi:hypothetical protein
MPIDERLKLIGLMAQLASAGSEKAAMSSADANESVSGEGLDTHQRRFIREVALSLGLPASARDI